MAGQDNTSDRDPGGGGGLAAPFATAFDDTTIEVALLDPLGRIMAVNEAWRRFGRDNGLRVDYDFLGISYIQVCYAGVKQHSPYADAAWRGILEVLAGMRQHFELTYPCHSPNVKRYYLMTIAPLGGEAGGAVVRHAPIHLSSDTAAVLDANTGFGPHDAGGPDA